MSNPDAPSQVTDAVASVIHGPEAPAASSLHGSPRPEEEDDGDLNKALGVQRFQQILTPAAAVPDKEHHIYHDEDIEYHRHSSHHIHRPLSKLPSDVRRRKGSKKRKKDKDHKSSHPPCSVPIEEGEDEEEEEEEGTELNSVLSERSESERTKDVEFFVSEDDHVSKSVKESPHSVRKLDIVPQSGVGGEHEDATYTE